VSGTPLLPPCWLDPQPDDPLAREILVCTNGLLHLPSGKLLEPTPRFFTTSALPFAYNPNATSPQRWLKCLEEWWPDCPESRACLQEIFGYLLIPDTSLQKIFLLIGRSRGGKGTITRVLVYLLGSANRASPTMDQLAQPFGMQSLIGKQLATMTDLYVHKARGASLAVENLLRISGEDDVTVQRKHKTDWIGRLPSRFLLAATVAPILPDMSGSLANRYVPLLIKQTFADNPDPYLFEEKLIPEMPGILNWAVDGWQRLKQRGHFVLAEEGQAIVRDLRARANPVEAFLRERCVMEKGARVLKLELYEEFREWMLTVDGLSYHHMDQSEFTRRLVVASGYQVGETKPRTGADGRQEYHYTNVRLRDVEANSVPVA
jgi:P4 family phage/plasmid primase-like protien